MRTYKDGDDLYLILLQGDQSGSGFLLRKNTGRAEPIQVPTDQLNTMREMHIVDLQWEQIIMQRYLAVESYIAQIRRIGEPVIVGGECGGSAYQRRRKDWIALFEAISTFTSTPLPDQPSGVYVDKAKFDALTQVSEALASVLHLQGALMGALSRWEGGSLVLSEMAVRDALAAYDSLVKILG